MRFLPLLLIILDVFQYRRGIQQVACINESSLVGLTNDLTVVVSDGGQWRAGPTSARVLDLWRAPDHRVFIWSTGPWVEEVLKGDRPGSHWTLPSETTRLTFTFIREVVAVTSDHLYLLKPGGEVKAMEPTPVLYPGFHSHFAPVVLGSGETTVSCFATSVHEDDDVHAECIRPGKVPYHYLVDFGESRSSFESDLSPPFLCGDTVVSVRRGVTQARRFSTGARVGRTAMAARRGSGCVDTSHVMLVGARDIGVFELPALRRTWRRAFPGKIAAAAVCDTKAVVALEKTPDPLLIALPAPQ